MPNTPEAVKAARKGVAAALQLHDEGKDVFDIWDAVAAIIDRETKLPELKAQRDELLNELRNIHDQTVCAHETGQYLDTLGAIGRITQAAIAKVEQGEKGE